LKNKTGEIAQLEQNQRDIEDRLQREALAAQKLAAQELAKPASTKKHSQAEPDKHWNPVGSNNIVNIAMDYLKVPYLWGGTTPRGFDCSGFTSYVFRKAGVPIPRTSAGQFGSGTPISRSALKLGDLVFFSSHGTIHHVGIYIGNDSMIDAPQAGDVVRVRSFSAHRGYAGARRYI
jgi:cell wall-associated NlpC family hydrolase